jgi:transposase
MQLLTPREHLEISRRLRPELKQLEREIEAAHKLSREITRKWVEAAKENSDELEAS